MNKPVPEFMVKIMKSLPYHNLAELSQWSEGIEDPIDLLISSGLPTPEEIEASKNEEEPWVVW